MATPFEWVIDADELSPSKLGDLLDELAGLLVQIDTELSPSSRRTFNLRITALSYNSPARIAVIAEPRRNQLDQTATAVAECIAGLGLVGRSIRPLSFNDEALEHLRKVGNITGNGVRSVGMVSQFVSDRAIVTRNISATVERLLPHGYSVGSVEGTLEALNIHQQPQFSVYDAVTGRAVRCYFDESRLGDVKALVGRKILVSGNLRRDPSGRPQQIRPVEFFRPVDDEPVVAVQDPAGLLDFVDDPKQYLDMIRGE